MIVKDCCNALFRVNSDQVEPFPLYSDTADLDYLELCTAHPQLGNRSWAFWNGSVCIKCTFEQNICSLTVQTEDLTSSRLKFKLVSAAADTLWLRNSIQIKLTRDIFAATPFIVLRLKVKAVNPMLGTFANNSTHGKDQQRRNNIWMTPYVNSYTL